MKIGEYSLQLDTLGMSVPYELHFRKRHEDFEIRVDPKHTKGGKGSYVGGNLEALRKHVADIMTDIKTPAVDLIKMIWYNMDVHMEPPFGDPMEVGPEKAWGDLTKMVETSEMKLGNTSYRGVSLDDNLIRPLSGNLHRLSIKWGVVYVHPTAPYKRKYFLKDDSGTFKVIPTVSLSDINNGVMINHTDELESFFIDLCSGLDGLAERAIRWMIQDDVHALMQNGGVNLLTGPESSDG